MNNIPDSFSIPSFFYHDEPADLLKWKTKITSQKQETGFSQIETEYISPDDLLSVSVIRRDYSDFPVTEIIPVLTARGENNTGIIRDFKSADIKIPVPHTECAVRAVHGARTIPLDFSARTFILNPFADSADSSKLRFTCGEGRSSSAWMPWFGLDFSAAEGWEFAVGWTGAWITEFEFPTYGDSLLSVKAGMEDSRFYMKPGETFRQPSMLIFHRESITAQAFQTVIRNFMLRHKSPRNSKGELIRPILPITGSGGNRPTDFLIREISYVKKYRFPFDTFWIDAGWYGPPHEPDATTNCGDCWSKYAGDWRVNPVRHPGGLRPAANAAHQAGLKFMLWFEPERAAFSAPVTREHPEYFYHLEKDSENNLLNMGSDEAEKWIFDTVCRHIETIGIDIYRQDFNLNPLPVWRNADEENRKGVCEIKHIMGLYRYLDDLRKRFPDIALENCASGGRRLDFEMNSRAFAYCRSDYYIWRSAVDPSNPIHNYQIIMGQNAVMNTLAYVPFQGGEANPAVMFSSYEFFSLCAAGIVFTPPDWTAKFPDDDAFSNEERNWLLARFRDAAKLRDILTGEFYILTDKTSLNEDVWAAYQGWNPEINQGAVVCFRRKYAPDAVKSFVLNHIDETASYELTDAVSGKTEIISGGNFRNYTVTLNQPESVKAVFYKKI